MERFRRLSQMRWWRLLWAGLCILTLANLAVAIVRTAEDEGLLKGTVATTPASVVLAKLEMGITYQWQLFGVVLLLAYFAAGRQMQKELGAAWRASRDHWGILFGRTSLVINLFLLLVFAPTWWFLVQLFGLMPTHYICLGATVIPLVFVVGATSRIYDGTRNFGALPPDDGFATYQEAPAAAGKSPGEPGGLTRAPAGPVPLLTRLRQVGEMLDAEYGKIGGRNWFTTVASQALRAVEAPKTERDTELQFICKLSDGEYFSCSVACLRNTLPFLLRWVRESPERFVLLCSALRGCRSSDAALRSLEALSCLVRHYPQGTRKLCFQQFEMLVRTLEQRFGVSALPAECEIAARSRAEGFTQVTSKVLTDVREFCYR